VPNVSPESASANLNHRHGGRQHDERPHQDTIMDMNQLFYHHQMAVIAADRAHRAGEAPAGFDLPNHYARRINRFREKRGLEPDFVGYSSAHARRPVAVIKTGSGAIALDIA
jgi:hypothetical protein